MSTDLPWLRIALPQTAMASSGVGIVIEPNMCASAPAVRPFDTHQCAGHCGAPLNQFSMPVDEGEITMMQQAEKDGNAGAARPNGAGAPGQAPQSDALTSPAPQTDIIDKKPDDAPVSPLHAFRTGHLSLSRADEPKELMNGRKPIFRLNCSRHSAGLPKPVRRWCCCLKAEMPPAKEAPSSASWNI